MNDLSKRKLDATAESLLSNPTDLMIRTALTYAYHLGALDGTDKTGNAMISAMYERMKNGLAS